MALAGYLTTACMRINMWNTIVELNLVFIRVPCVGVFSFWFFLSLTSSANVELILEGKDGTSSEEIDLWKGKFISVMTTLMHQHVSVCHGRRIWSRKTYLENEWFWTENIFASCIPIKMSFKLKCQGNYLNSRTNIWPWIMDHELSKRMYVSQKQKKNRLTFIPMKLRHR